MTEFMFLYSTKIEGRTQVSYFDIEYEVRLPGTIEIPKRSTHFRFSQPGNGSRKQTMRAPDTLSLDI